ncbi:hypothetical protein [Glutamicibacter sp. NPDC090743]|uniref:hypothetical protein n=1 Tax=Glutamicibacter sp. NPDC090743 TaxID=3364001 RepID=UPI0038136AEF
MADKKKATTSPWFWGVVVVVVLVAAGLGVLRWITLPEPKYFFPVTAGDWAAWGAVVGSAGTIGAVIYAARTFKSSADAQQQEQHDRRKEMDYLEGLEGEEAKKLVLYVTGTPRTEDEWGTSFEVIGAVVELTNYSDAIFRDLQLYIPRASLKEGNSITNVQIFSGVLKDKDGYPQPIKRFSDKSEIKWHKPTLPLTPNAELTHFPLGDLPKGQAIRVAFDFDGPEDETQLEWSIQPQHSTSQYERESVVCVSYVDRAGKHWMRSTHDQGRARRLRYPSFEQTL